MGFGYFDYRILVYTMLVIISVGGLRTVMV